MRTIFTRLAAVAILLLAMELSHAQDIHFSQFYASPLTLNPAMKFRAFVVERWSRGWVQAQKSRPLRELVEQASVLDDDLRNLRGKTVQKVKRWCAAERPIAARLLVPEVDGRGRQRLPMAPASIALRG
jgi:tryptophan 2,3-dioxygenase